MCRSVAAEITKKNKTKLHALKMQSTRKTGKMDRLMM
jgi:hypothetical protein